MNQRYRTLESLLPLIQQTAGGLSTSLRRLGFLNGEIDAPISERNLVVHLAHQFIGRGYEVYAEPALNTGAGRIDLVASGPTSTYAVEVKVLGNRDPGRFLRDFERLRNYVPVAARRSDGEDAAGFWKESSDRCGLLVIGSFGGEQYSDLWRAQVADPDRFDSRLKDYSRLRSSRKENWRLLAERLRECGGVCGVEPVLEAEFWPKAAALDLLWATFPIA